jgi:ribosomal protein L11 methylase PrmA
MNYGVPASEGGGAPRLMGIYEASLSPIIASAPDLIIDIGSAEGYYAVGLARRLHHATFWARDADAHARQKCRDLAGLNGVADRVEVGGKMTHADFDICLRHRSVVIRDIEGG